ncbi:M23 family metallopeptidase [Iningainema tapete]|uniref:M23 family metallopeptidase n=1 Tax=Iningainema tapete BLCC-T55 TaxID=2748662 RepID=A0A8J6XHU8_9CYAN|nr:M23 family metallopeptidase [Iningainema tapete]MBD2777110.1 M23 family metallopeptidase [Iningainema tapete BLCC-T55]
MKQRDKAQNSRANLWQRSLPAQSLCWLSSFSLLSSGIVFAQTESAVDNIVPTVENSAPAVVNNVQKDTSEANNTDSSDEYSRRRAKLRQRLRRVDLSVTQEQVKPSQPKNEESQTAVVPRWSRRKIEVSLTETRVRRLRARLADRERNQVIAREEKPQPEFSQQRTNVREDNQNSSQSSNSVRASTRKPKDYNNAYIDPTDYNTASTQKYEAPNSIVVTERSTGCRALIGPGISSRLCAKTPLVSARNQTQTNSDNEQTPKQVPSWLRRSQNAQLTNVSPTRRIVSSGDNTDVRPQVNNDEKETNTYVRPRRQVVAQTPETNTYVRPRRQVAEESEINTYVRPRRQVVAQTPETNTYVRRQNRIANNGEPKSAFRPNRFIPNNFSPTTTVSSHPIAPSGGDLPEPMTADNSAPRPGTVAYNIPLASTLPQVTWNGRYAYSGTGGLVYPLTVPSPITSLFGWRNHPITGDRSFHSGTDIGAAIGTPILAAYSGQVEIADNVGGYGLTVVLNHTSAQQTLYGHMSEIFVQPGQWVEQGTVIGRVGNTGSSTGPHLHFEVRTLTPEGWVAIDPGIQLESALSQLVQTLQTAQTTPQPGS